MTVPPCKHDPLRYDPNSGWQGQSKSKGHCTTCWLWATNHQGFRDRHQGSLPASSQGTPAAVVVSLACVHRGAMTGEHDYCTGCFGKRMEIPTYRCAVHGECSADPHRSTNDVKSCRECKDRPIL